MQLVIKFRKFLFFNYRAMLATISLSHTHKQTDRHFQKNVMWPSQNFLLYNGTVIKIQVNEWINN